MSYQLYAVFAYEKTMTQYKNSNIFRFNTILVRTRVGFLFGPQKERIFLPAKEY